jgi:hypothetical protein
VTDEAGAGMGGHEDAPRRHDRPDLDAITGRVTASLIARSHLMRPGALAAELARAARPLGVSAVQLYLADLQQQHLVPLTSEDSRAAAVPGQLPIGGTLAGRAYQTATVQSSRAGTGHQLWIPLVDGTERLGILGLSVADASDVMLDRYRTLASLAGILIATKNSTSDTYSYLQRSHEMTLQAELVWAFLPPRTFATGQVLVAASLEPAYEVGGDAFDYSLLGDHLHVSVFDGLGHDLAAGLLAGVSLAACRSTRRAGGTLAAVMARADQAIASQFGEDRFVTALLCDLDIASGLLSWIPCGHPPPLLIRGNRTVRELDRRPQLPLGLGGLGERGGRAYDDADSVVPSTQQLEPGDRILLYTDGVTEGRAADGAPFGIERLSDFIIRHSSAGLPLSETMRRLNRAILDYQHGRLRDDATVILVEWQPGPTSHDLTP